MPTTPISPAAAEHYFGFAKQSAKGTAVAPTFFAAFVGQVQARAGKQTRQVREGGNGPYIARSVTDLYIPEWRAGAYVRPDLAGALYAFLLGTAATPSGTGPYTHTITPSTTPVWVSFERAISDEIMERLVDGFIVEMVLDIGRRDGGPEPLLEFTVTGLSLARQASATSDSYETDLPFKRSHATWKLDGSAVTNVESARLTHRWIYDPSMSTDAVTRTQTAKLQFETDVEVTTQWSTAADALAYKETIYPVAAEDGSGTAPAELVYQPAQTDSFEVAFDDGGAGAANRQLTVNIPVVAWTDAQITEPDPGATEAARLVRTGHLEVASPAITVTAINSRSTAYVG